jgi:hypothetical protein
MAQRKKAKRVRQTSPKKAKVAAKRGKSARGVVTKRAAAKTKSMKRSTPKQMKRAAPKKRPMGKAPKPLQPVETVIVDTVEEPVPGVVVVTEYEAVVQRPKTTND